MADKGLLPSLAVLCICTCNYVCMYIHNHTRIQTRRLFNLFVPLDQLGRDQYGCGWKETLDGTRQTTIQTNLYFWSVYNT